MGTTPPMGMWIGVKRHGRPRVKWNLAPSFMNEWNLAPSFMNEIFTPKETLIYNTKQYFKTHNVHSVYNGTETLSHIGPSIWLIIPDDIKESKSLKEFKDKIKSWKPKKCPCRLCKVYISGVGFIGSVGNTYT